MLPRVRSPLFVSLAVLAAGFGSAPGQTPLTTRPAVVPAPNPERTVQLLPGDVIVDSGPGELNPAMREAIRKSFQRMSDSRGAGGGFGIDPRHAGVGFGGLYVTRQGQTVSGFGAGGGLVCGRGGGRGGR
jgi:hypothetical protein